MAKCLIFLKKNFVREEALILKEPFKAFKRVFFFAALRSAKLEIVAKVSPVFVNYPLGRRLPALVIRVPVVEPAIEAYLDIRAAQRACLAPSGPYA